MADEFDPLRYIASYADLIRAFGANAEAGLRHWNEFGRAEGRNPLLFNPLLYAASNPDLIPTFGKNGSALTSHWINTGFHQGRSSNGFDPLLYGASNVDLLRALGSDANLFLHHWLETGYKEGRATAAFNPLLYAASNLDVYAAYGKNTAALTAHWVNLGYKEGRDPNAFDPLDYAAANPDLLRALGTNESLLLSHYLDTGLGERRPTAFDALLYGASNPDLARVFGRDEGLLRTHWLETGFKEGRPTSGFDHRQYAAANVDLLRAGAIQDQEDGILHYLEFGADEGRPTNFDERAYILTYPDLGPYRLSDAQALRHWLEVGFHEGRVGDTLYGHDQRSHQIGPGGTVSAFDRPGDRDWFQIDLPAGAPLVLFVSDPSGNPIEANVTLHNNFGTHLGTDRLVPGEEVTSLDITTTYSGLHYISVAGAQPGAYRLSITQGWSTLSIGGRSYTDADFHGMQRVRFLRIADNFETQIGANAQAAGIRFVTATSSGASVTDASAYTAGLTVDVRAGGADVVRTGSGNDHVLVADAAQTLSLGAGNDLVTGVLGQLHRIDGGAGIDTLRPTPGNVVLDVGRLSGIERIEATAELMLTLRGASAVPGGYEIVGTAERTGSPPFHFMRVTLAPQLLSADAIHVVAGPATSAHFSKENVGVANAVRFTGGIWADSFSIDVSDLGAHVTADGGGGPGNVNEDRLVLRGTVLDSHFTHFTSFEQLAGRNVDFTLGAEAARTGVSAIVLVPWDSNEVVFEPGFDRPVEILIRDEYDIGPQGSNVIDASLADAPVTFNVTAGRLDTAILTGSRFATDELKIAYLIYGAAVVPGADARNVTGVESIVIAIDSRSFEPDNFSHGWILIDTAPNEIQAAQQTITVVNGQGTPESELYAPIDASAATADLVISGTNRVKSGSGNDVITALAGSRSQIEAGAGNDIVNGAALTDVIFAGSGNDIVNGGGGADQIDLGTGSDRVRYTRLSDSAGSIVDTVYGFASAGDVIDVLNLQGFAGRTISFAGNALTLAQAQALLTPGDDTLDAVFQQDSSTLWFDNGDGVLNASDLQIVLSGVSALQPADVLHGSIVVG